VTASTTAELRVRWRRVGYRRVITLAGRLEAATVATLRQAFWDAVESGAQQIWLDLSDVTAIDGAGAQAVAALSPAAHELNRAVLVVCGRWFAPPWRSLHRAMSCRCSPRSALPSTSTRDACDRPRPRTAPARNQRSRRQLRRRRGRAAARARMHARGRVRHAIGARPTPATTARCPPTDRPRQPPHSAAVGRRQNGRRWRTDHARWSSRPVSRRLRAPRACPRPAARRGGSSPIRAARSSPCPRAA
jgi:anti-anti-sigma regulatory factor